MFSKIFPHTLKGTVNINIPRKEFPILCNYILMLKPAKEATQNGCKTYIINKI